MPTELIVTNNSSCGIEICSKVEKGFNCVEYTTKPNTHQQLFGFVEHPPVFKIAYEKFVQFEPKEWADMQLATANRLVDSYKACFNFPNPVQDISAIIEALKAYQNANQCHNDEEALLFDIGRNALGE